jgi:hypothetical protein
MVKFMFSLTYNVDELLQGFNQKRIWKLAWAARNLLELAIWVEYCNASPANAKQFRDDSARDLLGTGRSIQKHVELATGKTSAELHRALSELVKMAEDQFGVSDLKDDYTRVVEASLGRNNSSPMLISFYRSMHIRRRFLSIRRFHPLQNSTPDFATCSFPKEQSTQPGPSRCSKRKLSDSFLLSKSEKH